MSDNYLGNSNALELFAPSHRDDLIPLASDGPSPAEVASGESPGPIGNGTHVFNLTQEVPGGYEGSVVVVRRKFLLKELFTSSTDISFQDTTNEILSNVSSTALSLSEVKPGDTLLVKGATNADNNGRHKVLNVTFDPVAGTISIVVDTSLITEPVGSPITITQGYDSLWEVLEPETDYTIDLNNEPSPRYTVLTLTDGLYQEDFAYVIHRSQATFEFRPAQNSVTEKELALNLRNFARVSTDAVSQTTFNLPAGSPPAVNASTLFVTVDGVYKEGRNFGLPNNGEDWELSSDGLSITFDNPVTGRVVILDLSFSTVSRRASLSQGQIGTPPPGSVDTTELANGSVTEPKLATNSVSTIKIQDSAITNSKLADDSVDGNKILLQNDQFLNSLDNSLLEEGLLKLNNSNQTVLRSPNSALLDADDFIPITNNSIDLGKLSNQWKDLYLSGNIYMQPTQTVDGVDISDLENRVVALESGAGSPVKAGMLMMWMVDSAPPTGWLLAQGQVVSQATYPDLFAAIGTVFNTGGEGAGNFRLPDMRQRFPLGKASSGTGSGFGATTGVGGSIDHTHLGGLHSHDISHTHTIPAHYHSMGDGADLNILSSGSHTTSISHNHPVFNITNQGEHTTSITHKHPAFTTNAGTTSNPTFGGGAHKHTVGVTRWQSATAGASRVVYNGSGSTNTKTLPAVNSNGEHTHTLPDHTHVIDIPSYSANSSSDGKHNHTIDIPNFIGNSSSNGTHTHLSSDFAGRIGKVTGGVDGNSDMTTTSIDNPNSGLDGNVPTSSNNPPFLVVNFIIKT